jgi:hypothetical protein
MGGVGHIGDRSRRSVYGNRMGIVRHDRSVEAQSSSTVIFVPQHLLGHCVRPTEVASERVVSRDVPDNGRSQEFPDPGGIVREFEARVDRSDPLSVGMFGDRSPPYPVYCIVPIALRRPEQPLRRLGYGGGSQAPIR